MATALASRVIEALDELGDVVLARVLVLGLRLRVEDVIQQALFFYHSNIFNYNKVSA